jgi:hypothetical protein
MDWAVFWLETVATTEWAVNIFMGWGGGRVEIMMLFWKGVQTVVTKGWEWGWWSILHQSHVTSFMEDLINGIKFLCFVKH